VVPVVVVPVAVRERAVIPFVVSLSQKMIEAPADKVRADSVEPPCGVQVTKTFCPAIDARFLMYRNCPLRLGTEIVVGVEAIANP
jgi:hypothetical protein